MELRSVYMKIHRPTAHWGKVYYWRTHTSDDQHVMPDRITHPDEEYVRLHSVLTHSSWTIQVGCTRWDSITCLPY